MPLYEYDCPGCGQAFGKRVSIANADNCTCPRCNNKHPQRRLSRIAINGLSTVSSSSTVTALPGGL